MLSARNPMGQWQACPLHGTSHRVEDGCPDCGGQGARSAFTVLRTDQLYGTRWALAGLRNGWTMPAAPWWKRLPIIRHVRVMHHAARLVIWEDFWTRAGYVPNGYDDWVLAGMWRGWEERADG